MSACFIAPGVSRRALGLLLDRLSRPENELHTLSVYTKRGLALRLAPAPYDPAQKREVYSLSKSFCSTAIGLLCDEGRLSVRDRIVDLFPDLCPDAPGAHLQQMEVRHVLSMNTGHEACVMPQMVSAENAARAFLACPVPYAPGTHFAYNTGATCLLSCIVQRITGKTLLDYLNEKLFVPMGIQGVSWNRIPSGENEGGCGIQVSNDDIARLGLLYLNEGMWGNQRLLSREWVREATHIVSDNCGNGTADWSAGYGYQFWMNAREGFRGDGAYGQLCVVLPDRDTVFALQTEVGDMQYEMDALMDFADHMWDEDDTLALTLPDYRPAASQRRLSGLEGRTWRLEDNPMGWTALSFSYDAEKDRMGLFISDGSACQALYAGNGHWEEGVIHARKLKPKLLWLMDNTAVIPCHMAVSYEAAEGALTFRIRYLNCPHKVTLSVQGEGDALTLSLQPEHPCTQYLLETEAKVLRGFVQRV